MRQVRASAPAVFPWYPCRNATTARFPVAALAIFSADSTASAPVAVGSTAGSAYGESSPSRWTSAVRASDPSLQPVWVSRRTCATAAAVTAGCWCPKVTAPLPEVASNQAGPSWGCSHGPSPEWNSGPSTVAVDRASTAVTAVRLLSTAPPR